jgi:Flp pilus assembly pilin Flp
MHASNAHLIRRTTRRGAVAIEYALLAALVGVTVVGALWGLGNTLAGTFETIDSGVSVEAPVGGGGGGAVGGGGGAGADGHGPRSGHADGSNPGRGAGRDHAPRRGVDNPHHVGF